MNPALEPRPRIFQRRRILRVSLDAYDHAIQLLAHAARHRLGPITAVVGIANGGITPATGISGILRVPNYRIAARHNPTNAAYTPATGHVTVDPDPLTTDLQGHRLAGHILLVDDICGTGATFTAVRSALAPHLKPGTVVHTVALCRNAGTSLDPDLWIWTVDDWVHFPWEPPPADATVEDLPTPEQAEPA